MRVFYLDPGLAVPIGHHAMHCRLITGEFAARGFETRVFSHVQIRPDLQAELQAKAHFRHFSYWESDDDPICGWLNGFDKGVRITAEDLMRIGEIAPTDLVYMGGTLAAGLAAIVAWMGQRPIEAMPSVVVDFCLPAGMRVERNATGLLAKLPDPREEARPILLRFAARRVTPQILQRLRLVTFLRESSEVYARLLGCAVDTIPPPYEALTGRHNRVGARPITVAVLGHQLLNKGYDLVPEIVRLLLAQRSDLRFLIHNSGPDAPGLREPAKVTAAHATLREMAALDSRVTICELPAGKELWSSLLERSDIVLCPYVPADYFDRISGLACDALANAIPIVVPAGTSLHKLVDEFGGVGTVFRQHDAAAVAGATIDLIDDFDRYAARAHEAAMIWPNHYGARALVDAVLGLVGQN
jgi:glycosyltransferase involved in cell wall biosynthesis